MYSWYDGLRKTWLDICLKSLILEDRFTGNMVNGLKKCGNMNDSTVTMISISFEVIDLENVSCSDMQNHITVFLDIDCCWQVVSS